MYPLMQAVHHAIQAKLKPAFFFLSFFCYVCTFPLHPSGGKPVGKKHSQEQAYVESHALNLLVHWKQAIQGAHRWLLHCKVPSRERSSPVTMAWQEGGMGKSHVRRPGTRPGQSRSG